MQICRFYQQFGAASYNGSDKSQALPLSVYYAETCVLRELAAQESCIILFSLRISATNLR